LVQARRCLEHTGGTPVPLTGTTLDSLEKIKRLPEPTGGAKKLIAMKIQSTDTLADSSDGMDWRLKTWRIWL